MADTVTTTANAPAGVTKTAPKVQPRADVDPIFSGFIKSLQGQANDDISARPIGEQTEWFMPPSNGWSGDLFDWAGMSKPFDRKFSNDAFVAGISDATKPGTSGDSIITTLQIDYLACAERAFRARHTFRRPRAIVHVCGRRYLQGHDKGPLIQSVLEYVRTLVKSNKSTS